MTVNCTACKLALEAPLILIAVAGVVEYSAAVTATATILKALQLLGFKVEKKTLDKWLEEYLKKGAKSVDDTAHFLCKKLGAC